MTITVRPASDGDGDFAACPGQGIPDVRTGKLFPRAAQEGLFLAKGFSSRLWQGESIAHTVSFSSVFGGRLAAVALAPVVSAIFFSRCHPVLCRIAS
ncbi:hypothetical protein [Mitsuokella sp. AF33-22]|uniref:hypothetical protein n=1 Tax=Mitsuokella sp. AF33-22 TaxID=2292047 RepID=UPI0011C42ABC|nr:hypothetical protein [Mitsuokella sp. AF33-22]